METLREEAIELISGLPEKYLPSIISLMESFKDIPEENPPKQREKIDFSKYMNHGKRMFNSTEEIDEFIREGRRERF